MKINKYDNEMKKRFYLNRLSELESKNESELTAIEYELIREYSIELEILELIKGEST